MTIDHDPTRAPTAAADESEMTRMIMEGLREGATVADLKGVTRDTLEGVYAIAHRFYQNGQLDEAEAFFRFLCLYDFYNADYALGMGAVLHLKREYEKAIGMYAVAQALDLTDDRPMFHVGQCHLALGRLRKARECFEAVAGRAAGSELGTRAEAYLQAVKGDRKPGSEDSTGSSGEG
ncbi:SycD/LcrH family type III secretion system chaperone [Stenotrophomonas sp. CFBP 13725]|uniref:SycD/LcrH family type III secretion system chaperone n=1 Tax=Stenotrophomonas sp. CFBP 13725 TaxID=2775297 RepID=UPI002017172F|nr:SycD/LcrH family type III secretion system chaperone [Stenotrophomonas sp. CFBP 13725]